MRRALILSADVGQGHATVAEALADDLRDEGIEVDVERSLAVLGPVSRLVLEPGFAFHLGGARRSYDLAYRLFMGSALAGRAAERALTALAGGPLASAVRAYRPDVVVSTFPVTTAALGGLREAGRIDVPCAATISDVCGLRFWAHRGIDLHLAMYAASLPEIARRAGPGRARAVRPVLRRAFRDVPSREKARATLDLPSDGPVVVVSGGGWGVGELAAAARAALDLDGATVVALAGRSRETARALRAALDGDGRVRVLGFSERMPELLAAADALVHATGGVTALEANAVGCPVVTFGFPVAHVRANAGALAAQGLARTARTPQELRAALAEAVAAPDGNHPSEGRDLPRAASLVRALANRGAEEQPGVTRRRRRPPQRGR